MSDMKSSRLPSGRTRKVSKVVSLNSETPAGLFQPHKDHKYLVIDYGDAKIAVALANPHLPPFTWFGLCSIDVDWGRWLGPYRLRLIHAVPAFRDGEPGTIQLCDGAAFIHSRGLNSEDGYFPLADVGADLSRDRNYNGWTVEAVSERLFFERSHRRTGYPTIEVGRKASKKRARL